MIRLIVDIYVIYTCYIRVIDTLYASYIHVIYTLVPFLGNRFSVILGDTLSYMLAFSSYYYFREVSIWISRLVDCLFPVDILIIVDWCQV